jgi:hypothetical protein
MANCDGFFDAEGIPFEPPYQDAAVYTVWSADFFDPEYKKWLILCWFDTTYGEWQGLRYNLRDSRAQMSAWLERNNIRTFEEGAEQHGTTNTKRRH